MVSLKAVGTCLSCLRYSSHRFDGPSFRSHKRTSVRDPPSCGTTPHGSPSTTPDVGLLISPLASVTRDFGRRDVEGGVDPPVSHTGDRSTTPVGPWSTPACVLATQSPTSTADGQSEGRRGDTTCGRDSSKRPFSPLGRRLVRGTSVRSSVSGVVGKVSVRSISPAGTSQDTGLRLPRLRLVPLPAGPGDGPIFSGSARGSPTRRTTDRRRSFRSRNRRKKTKARSMRLDSPVPFRSSLAGTPPRLPLPCHSDRLSRVLRRGSTGVG